MVVADRSDNRIRLSYDDEGGAYVIRDRERVRGFDCERLDRRAVRTRSTWTPSIPTREAASTCFVVHSAPP